MDRDILIKKLLYRSMNRGCKELDMIIKSFADIYLNGMHMDDLICYQEVLDLNDHDFYSYILNFLRDDTFYPPVDNRVMMQIMHFVKDRQMFVE